MISKNGKESHWQARNRKDSGKLEVGKKGKLEVGIKIGSCP